jgi:hypothetical protein
MIDFPVDGAPSNGCSNANHCGTSPHRARCRAASSTPSFHWEREMGFTAFAVRSASNPGFEPNRTLEKGDDDVGAYARRQVCEYQADCSVRAASAFPFQQSIRAPRLHIDPPLTIGPPSIDARRARSSQARRCTPQSQDYFLEAPKQRELIGDASDHAACIGVTQRSYPAVCGRCFDDDLSSQIAESITSNSATCRLL